MLELFKIMYENSLWSEMTVILWLVLYIIVTLWIHGGIFTYDLGNSFSFDVSSV